MDMGKIKRSLKVFLSYASQDKSAVRDFTRRLTDQDWVDVWVDEKNLLPGQDWRTKIEEAVESSDVVIICLSSNSVSKEGFVQKELRYAREIAFEKPEETIFLIPIRLDDCNVPRGLRFYQWGDYFGDQKEKTLSSLLSALKLRHNQKLNLEEENARKEEEERERQITERIAREKLEWEATERLRRQEEKKVAIEETKTKALEKKAREKKEHRTREKKQHAEIEPSTLKQSENSKRATSINKVYGVVISFFIILTVFFAVKFSKIWAVPLATPTVDDSLFATSSIDITGVTKVATETTPFITITPEPSYPLEAGASLPELSEISLNNLDNITEIARWGDGIINDVAISKDNSIVFVGTSIGIFEYSTSNLEKKNFIPCGNISKLVVSEDGKKLIYLEDSKLMVLDLATYESKDNYNEADFVNLQSFPNGDIFALRKLTGKDETVFHVINVKNLSELMETTVNVSGSVYAEEVSGNGDLLIVTQNKTVSSYNISTSKKEKSYEGQQFFVTANALSPNQKLLATGDHNGNVYIWNVENGQPIYKFNNSDGVSRLIFSPDSNTILAAFDSGIIQAWDVTTGKKGAGFSGHVNMISTLSFSQNNDRIISGSVDGKIIMWSYPDGKRLLEIPANSAGITSMDISPDGSMIATGSNDNNVILWDRNNGRVLKELTQFANSFFNFSGCSNCDYYGVQSLKFSLDGYSLAAGYTSAKGIIWDVSSGRPVISLEGDSFAYCANQDFLIAASNKAVHFYDLVTGDETNKFSGKTCSVETVACSPNGSLYAYRGTLPGCGGLPDKIIVVKLDYLVDLYEFRDDKLYGPELGFSPDGKLLAAGASDGIRLWETDTGKEISGPTLEQEVYPSLADFSPDGKILVYKIDDTHLGFYDILREETVFVLEETSSSFRTFEFSGDGKILVTGHSDGIVRVWGVMP